MAEPLVFEMSGPGDLDAMAQTIAESIQASLDDLDFADTFEEKVFPLLEAGEQAAFDSQSSPGGEAWAPNAPSTVASKGHGIVLHEHGPLEDSLVGRTGDSIRDADQTFGAFGTSVEYSAFNEYGTAKIPARPHVGMSEETCDAVVDVIADEVIEQIKQ